MWWHLSVDSGGGGRGRGGMVVVVVVELMLLAVEVVVVVWGSGGDGGGVVVGGVVVICSRFHSFLLNSEWLQKDHERAKRRRLSLGRVAVGEPAKPSRLKLSVAAFECRLALEHFRREADVLAVACWRPAPAV